MSQMLFDQRDATSGNAISIDNIKNIGFIDTLNQINVASGTAVPNFQLGSLVLVNITANAAITVGTPINLPVPLAGGTAVGLQWVLFIQNSSGGTLSTAPTVNSSYRISGSIPSASSWTTGVGISMNLFWDGTHHTSIGPITTTAF